LQLRSVIVAAESAGFFFTWRYLEKTRRWGYLGNYTKNGGYWHERGKGVPTLKDQMTKCCDTRCYWKYLDRNWQV
jgi:hypothetical protein